MLTVGGAEQREEGVQLAVRSSSLRGWLPVQATHNGGGGGRGQTTSLPKRKREEREERREKIIDLCDMD